MPNRQFLTLGSLILTGIAMSACQSTPPTHDELVRADFFDIISLKGLSCDSVTDYDLSEEGYYRITCSTGDIYHLEVNPVGRVELSPVEVPDIF